VLVETEKPISADQARAAFAAFPGLVVVDDPGANLFPTPNDVAGRDEVLVGHSESVNVQTREPLSPEQCRELLSSAPGVVVVDNPADGLYPLATDVAGRDDVLVGRIRRDPSHDRCLNLWIVGDNLRKGAATNAVQVAELISESLASPVRSLG